jgi:uncharacterized membrane protein YraQ (UPF0718 family)/copper chaperone CopZ
MMDYVNAFVSMLNGMSPYLLLGFLIAGLLHAFVPSTIYSRYLAGTGFRSVVTAALFGIPLPLCSCGVLPTAVSLRRSGASRAASTSFLIATPQTGVDSITATYSMMGLPFAVLRPVAALVTALVGGMAVGKAEKEEAATAGCGLSGATTDTESAAPRHGSAWAKLMDALRYGFVDMMESIGKWLVLGLVVATLITVLVPDDFFATYARYPLLNMLVILLIAVPMYICATGSIPIAAALVLKGMSPGCALVLLMAGPAANVASVLVVKKAFGRRATMVYLASIVGGALAFGLGVDYLPGLRKLFLSAMPHLAHSGHHMMSMGWFSTACSVLLVGLLVLSFVRHYVKRRQLKHQNTTAMKQYKITGMSCIHCSARVENGLRALEGVESVSVDLEKGMAYVEGSATDAAVIGCVTALGYEAEAL